MRVVRELMGPVEQVSAYAATLTHERIEVEDVATATLRFANGALGVIEATTAAYPGTLTVTAPARHPDGSVSPTHSTLAPLPLALRRQHPTIHAS